MELSDTRVAVCGDWHGNVGWVRTLAPAIGRLAPDVTTILQVGDWWMDTELTDPVFLDAGIERVLVTLGNHEPWPRVVRALDVAPGEAVQVSEVTWLLPRPYRFGVGGRQILSLGGATSVDQQWRVPGREWWAEEAITDEHVDAAIAGGPADVMLTHASPARTPVRAVQEILSRNPTEFPDEVLVESAESRERVARVWDAVRPDVLMHGHMHAPGAGTTNDGRRVVSLGRDTQDGSLALVDLATLSVVSPSLREIREAAHG